MSNNLKLLLQEIGLVLFVLLATFGSGYMLGYHNGHKNAVKGQNSIDVAGKVEEQTSTVIAYVKKTQNNEHDLVANVQKPDFSIQINGQTTTFNKSEDEQYLFQKNQLQLNQTSKVNFDVTVKPIDLTKHWALGLGYDSGLEIMLSAPISPLFDTYIHGNDKQIGLGILLRF